MLGKTKLNPAQTYYPESPQKGDSKKFKYLHLFFSILAFKCSNLFFKIVKNMQKIVLPPVTSQLSPH